MLSRLECRCETCDRRLADETAMFTFERDGCVRHAYECRCGAVTITVARD